MFRGPDGQWYDSSDSNSPVVIFDPDSGCLSRIRPKAYVTMIHNGTDWTSYIIVLCWDALKYRSVLGQARFRMQLNVPLDECSLVSASILHELLHISSKDSELQYSKNPKSMLTF